MKSSSFRALFSPEKAAALVAFSFLGLNAHGALSQQQGPAAVPASAAGAPSFASAPSGSGTAAVPNASSATHASADDILDIRPPIHIPGSFPWLPVGAGATAVAGLGAAAWKLLRRRRRKLPYEIALEQLENTRPLMQEDNAQPFSLAVSEIVRSFIESTHPVRAAHRTTAEFLRDLVSLPESPLAAHREMLGEFLHHCDLAKFARWSLTRPQMEAMLQSACAFVIATGKPALARKPAATLPASVPASSDAAPLTAVTR